jgi:hypothetical protein
MALMRHLDTSATLWTVTGKTNAGDPIFAVPTSISVRWEEFDAVRTYEHGQMVDIKHVVYVDQAVARGSWLFEGTSVEADPRDVDGAYEVRSSSAIPNVRHTETVWKCLL